MPRKIEVGSKWWWVWTDSTFSSPGCWENRTAEPVARPPPRLRSEIRGSRIKKKRNFPSRSLASQFWIARGFRCPCTLPALNYQECGFLAIRVWLIQQVVQLRWSSITFRFCTFPCGECIVYFCSVSAFTRGDLYFWKSTTVRMLLKSRSLITTHKQVLGSGTQARTMTWNSHYTEYPRYCGPHELRYP